MNIPKKVLVINVAVLAILMLASAGFLRLAQRNYQVVAKGPLLEYTEGQIYQIRFFDAFDLYLEPEHSVDSDLFSFYFLIGIGFISMTFFVILGFGKVLVRRRVLWLYLLTWLGMNYLAFDEFLGIHESIGHNLQFLAALPLIKCPDDAIVMFYLIPCLIYGILFYKEFLPCKKAIIAGLAAFGLIVLAAISDVLTLPVEEGLEILAGVSLLTSILLLGLHHLDPENTRPTTVG